MKVIQREIDALSYAIEMLRNAWLSETNSREFSQTLSNEHRQLVKLKNKLIKYHNSIKP